MEFLTPLYLALGAAAAVPLFVHLLRRRSGVRTVFPAVRYLMRAEQEHSLQLRVRNLLLMVLRMAAVLLLALAAARPFARAIVPNRSVPVVLRAKPTIVNAVPIAPLPAIEVDSSAGPFVSSAVAALVAGGEAVTVGAGLRSSGRSPRGLPRPSSPMEIPRSSSPIITIANADRVTALPAVIIAPLDPVRIGAANRALTRLDIPWAYGALQRAEGQWWYMLVSRPWNVDSDTLLPHNAVGGPWTVRGPGYVLIGSPLDPQASTMPLKAGFVPWIKDLIAQRGRTVKPAPLEWVQEAEKPGEMRAQRTFGGLLLVAALSLLLVETFILRRGTSSASRRDRASPRVRAVDPFVTRTE